MSSFRAQLERAYKVKVEEKLDDVTRKTSLLLHGELVNNTPVDTGRARANWNIDVNNIDVSLVEPGTQPNTGSVNRVKAGDTVYISNNLPYIRRLNEGYSDQAPSGFVEAAVQVANRKAKELAKT